MPETQQQVQKVVLTATSATKNVALVIHDAAQVSTIVTALVGKPELGTALAEVFKLAEIALERFADAETVEITPVSIMGLLAVDTPLAEPTDGKPADAQSEDPRVAEAKARAYVMSRGYSEEAAKDIVEKFGADSILADKAEEASKAGQAGTSQTSETPNTAQ